MRSLNKMATKLRQWIFARPMVNDFLGPKQFELREVPIPELQLALVRVKLVNIPVRAREWPTG
jgi:hypothetical protein